MKNIKMLFSLALIVWIVLMLLYNNKSVKLAKEIEKSYTYDGQTIELEGRLKAPFLTRTGNTTSMELEVFNDFFIIENGKKILSPVKMNYGEGKNSVIINVPEGSRDFKQSDVILFDNNGNKLKASDKVKITGVLSYPNKGVKKESTVKNYTTGKETKKEEEDYSYELTNVVVYKN